jgi:hypothetical protein
MASYLTYLLIFGTILACALSLVSFALSRRRYTSNRITRAIVSVQADVADCTEKLEHLTGLFKRMSARVAQRERRKKENGEPSGEDLSPDEFKRNWRRQNLEKLTLNSRR